MVAEVEFSGVPIKVHLIHETSTPTLELLTNPEIRSVVMFEEFPHVPKGINFPWV